jgi:hypothetical protein
MTSPADSTPADTSSTHRTLTVTVGKVAAGFALLSVLAVDPALAQSIGTSFCETDLAKTARNIFTVLQFGGPLLGGIIALGATVGMPAIRSSDTKRELKKARAQAFIWGILVAPIGATIIGFVLNNVVAGGASCGF